MDILLLGGSITAGGYFMEFIRLLDIEAKLNVSYHNHGHGAIELQCKPDRQLCINSVHNFIYNIYNCNRYNILCGYREI